MFKNNFHDIYQEFYATVVKKILHIIPIIKIEIVCEIISGGTYLNIKYI